MATLEQQIQAKLDELNALKEKQRKKENQEKIILGALLLDACKSDKNICDIALNLIYKASDKDRKKLEQVRLRIYDMKDEIKEEKKLLSDELHFEDESTKHNIF